MKENKRMSKKNLIALIALVVVLMASTITIFLMWPEDSSSSETPKNPIEAIVDYVKRVVYQRQESEDLGNPRNDVGVMLFDCDSTDVFSKATNISVVSKPGKYLQGTAAFGRVSPKVTMGTGVFDKEVDISAYKNGSIHISMYVSNPEKMKNAVWLELSSSGAPDKDEISWVIPRSVMKAGWNEFYLSIPKAYSTGEIDLTKINYYRMYELQAGFGVTIYYDNVYATNTPGTAYKPDIPAVEPDDYEESTTTKGKMIMSCDTVNILRGITNAKVTVKKNEHVQGTGAFKLDWETGGSGFALKNAVDLSAYQEGYIHLSLYINDASLITKRVILELTSSGTSDADEFTYIINKEDLVNGWNHLWIPTNSVAAKIGSPNLSKINFLRVYGDKVEKGKGITVFLDDVYATMEGKKDEFAETAAPYANSKMIASCNTINIFKKLNYAKVTTADGEFVEGTGAMKTTSKMSTIFEGVLNTPVDISWYGQNNGYLHYSIYIDNLSKCGDSIVLELTSAGVCDKDEYTFTKRVNTLKKGWNDVYIQLTERTAKKGNPDLTKINYVRVYHTNYDDKDLKQTIILDNICMTDKQYDSYTETKAVDGQMIVSGNTLNIFKTTTGVVTTKAREFVEGTGALKSTVTKGSMTGLLDLLVNISSYAADGYIHVSFYNGNLDNMGDRLVLELSSSDTVDTDEYQWSVAKSTLSNGWNELSFKMSDATKIGNPDPSAIKRFRIYASGSKDENAIIIDNLYASMNAASTVASCACGKPVYAGDLVMGNCMCNFASSFNMALTKECVEGAYALQAKNPQAGMYATFAKAVDISSSKNGYIHLRIYVDDVEKLNNNISFELSSSGTYDNNEYAWEIKKSSLTDGWNEIKLSLSKAAVTGSPDLKAINYFRLYSAKPDKSLVLILDDVYAIGK